MNPGELNTKLILQAPTTAKDDLGQPLPGWSDIRVLMAKRMPGKPQAEATAGDRQTEGRKCLWKIRTQPFLTLYRAGYRILETSRPGFPATVWGIDGFAEADMTRGNYLLLTTSTPSERGE